MKWHIYSALGVPGLEQFYVNVSHYYPHMEASPDGGEQD
jgi:hypothetical protein